jgi:hypothetical protein
MIYEKRLDTIKNMAYYGLMLFEDNIMEKWYNLLWESLKIEVLWDGYNNFVGLYNE